VTEIEALYAQLPRLQESDHRITSPATDDYNCVAWVDRDTDRWWEPGFYWPEGIPEPTELQDLEHYVDLFRSLGFELCGTGDLEDGYLKIAIYSGEGAFHHVAKQLPSGAWSSKAGVLHDLRHDELAAFEECGVMKYATVTAFMRRPYDGEDPMELEETGLLTPP
jgi:hypothetical protein